MGDDYFKTVSLEDAHGSSANPGLVILSGTPMEIHDLSSGGDICKAFMMLMPCGESMRAEVRERSMP